MLVVERLIEKEWGRCDLANTSPVFYIRGSSSLNIRLAVFCTCFGCCTPHRMEYGLQGGAAHDACKI